MTPTDQPEIVVRKRARTLEVILGGEIKLYKAAFGSCPAGDKQVEGDGRTPEGEFYVFTKNHKSKFHLSLGISYPSVSDARRGLSGGLISREEHDQIVEAIAAGKMPPQKTPLGGEIYVHGGGSDDDWTDGCVAVTDAEMEEIFAAAAVGTKVTILP